MRIDPQLPFCVFAHVYDDGEVFMGASKLESALRPRNMKPFFLEILSLHKTYGSAYDALTPQKTGGDGRGRPPKGVFCISTGHSFASVTEAAKACGVHASNLSNLIRGKGKSLKGLTFREAVSSDPPPRLSAEAHLNLLGDLRGGGIV